MKLHADRAPLANHRGESVILVDAPGTYDVGARRAAREAVRVVCDVERSAGERRVARVLDRRPANMRYPTSAKPGDTTFNHAQPFAASLFASIEEKLHPETDAHTRQPSLDRFA